MPQRLILGHFADLLLPQTIDRFWLDITFNAANLSDRVWVEGCRCRAEKRMSAFHHSPTKTRHSAVGPISDATRHIEKTS